MLVINEERNAQIMQEVSDRLSDNSLDRERIAKENEELKIENQELKR